MRRALGRHGALLLGLAIGMATLLSPASTAEPAPQAKDATVFGAHIRYYDVGSGPVVVLLHGLGSSALGDWGAVLPQLAKRHRVIALDQLGFGGSAKPMVG